MSVGGLIGLGGGIAQGLIGSGAAKSGANQMAQGNLLALLLQQQMWNQAAGKLDPFIGFGQGAFKTLAPLIGIGGNPLTAELTRKFQPTMAELEKTPGYQFNLSQGLKTAQNNAAMKGLGVSGNAMRGAMDYASGLASNTYQQQFQNYWDQNKNIYNMLSGAGGVGLSAAQSLMGGASNFANMMGSSLQGYGNAMGQGTINSAVPWMNAISGGIGALQAGSPSWWNNSAASLMSNPLKFFG